MVGRETDSNQAHFGKPWKYRVGLFLTAIAGVSVLIAFAQSTRTWFADFPCGYYFYPEALVQPDTRIAYCIDFVGRHVASGAGIYAEGTVRSDDTVVEPYAPAFGFSKIHIRRTALLLEVDGHPVNVGQSYMRLSWSPSLNPWLLYANRLTVWNQGLSKAPEALLVSGELYEGWLLSPLGPVALFAGILLIYTGRKELSRRAAEAA